MNQNACTNALTAGSEQYKVDTMANLLESTSEKWINNNINSKIIYTILVSGVIINTIKTQNLNAEIPFYKTGLEFDFNIQYNQQSLTQSYGLKFQKDL